MLPALVRGDLEVVGEDDGPGGEFGLVDLLELPYCGGGAVRLVRRLVGELEEVDELGRVAFLLPRGVDAGAGLMLGHVRDELGDGGLDLVHCAWVHLGAGGLVGGHEFAHGLSLLPGAWRGWAPPAGRSSVIWPSMTR